MFYLGAGVVVEAEIDTEGAEAGLEDVVAEAEVVDVINPLSQCCSCSVTSCRYVYSFDY